MFNAVRSVRAISPPCNFSYFLLTNITTTTRKATGFAQAVAGENHNNMDKNNKQQQEEDLSKVENKRDSMDSLGEGYSSRCDEEGFGGIYSGKQSFLSKDEEDKVVRGNVPQYDESQRNEVKEKEKEKERARNQEKVVTHDS